MIRDPSDGSVRVGHQPKSLEEKRDRKESDVLVSGLPDAPAKSDELIRLEKSREWLKLYSLKSGFSPSTM